jgi:hypothetical protein
VHFDGDTFVPAPNYDEGRGVRLRGKWPTGIERATEGSDFEDVPSATSFEGIMRFAFGFAPASDLEPGRLPAEIASCLGL